MRITLDQLKIMPHLPVEARVAVVDEDYDHAVKILKEQLSHVPGLGPVRIDILLRIHIKRTDEPQPLSDDITDHLNQYVQMMVTPRGYFALERWEENCQYLLSDPEGFYKATKLSSQDQLVQELEPLFKDQGEGSFAQFDRRCIQNLRAQLLEWQAVLVGDTK